MKNDETIFLKLKLIDLKNTFKNLPGYRPGFYQKRVKKGEL